MDKLQKALDSISENDSDEKLVALADYVLSSDDAIAEDISAVLSDYYLSEVENPVEFFEISFEDLELDRLGSDETSNPRDELEYSMVIGNKEKVVSISAISEVLDEEELGFLKGCLDSYKLKIPVHHSIKHDGREFYVEDSIDAEWSCKDGKILIKVLA